MNGLNYQEEAQVYRELDKKGAKIKRLEAEIARLRAELAPYKAAAAEYGVDAQTMLTLAKSQIATAKENAKLREAQRWIAVEERLPEDDKTVSFYTDGRLAFTSVFCVTHGIVSIRNRMIVKPTGTPYLDDQVTDGWVWGTGDEPTHWRKLPDPPQKGENEA